MRAFSGRASEIANWTARQDGAEPSMGTRMLRKALFISRTSKSRNPRSAMAYGDFSTLCSSPVAGVLPAEAARPRASRAGKPVVHGGRVVPQHGVLRRCDIEAGNPRFLLF